MDSRNVPRVCRVAPPSAPTSSSSPSSSRDSHHAGQPPPSITGSGDKVSFLLMAAPRRTWNPTADEQLASHHRVQLKLKIAHAESVLSEIRSQRATDLATLDVVTAQRDELLQHLSSLVDVRDNLSGTAHPKEAHSASDDSRLEHLPAIPPRNIVAGGKRRSVSARGRADKPSPDLRALLQSRDMNDRFPPTSHITATLSSPRTDQPRQPPWLRVCRTSEQLRHQKF